MSQETHAWMLGRQGERMTRRFVPLARAALLAAWIAGTAAHSHQTPPGDVYPVVTRADRGFVVTYRSSIENRNYAQPYGLDGKPSAAKKAIPKSEVPSPVRTVNKWPRPKGLSADKEQAVLRVIFLGYGTTAGVVTDGTSAEWIRMTNGDASLCRLRISTLEQRCEPLGRVLDGPMGLELLDEPLARGSERAVFWVNEQRQLMFSSWERYSEVPVRTRLVGDGFSTNTWLASAVNGDVALVAAHLPGPKGLFRIHTWTTLWPVGRGTPDK